MNLRALLPLCCLGSVLAAEAPAPKTPPAATPAPAGQAPSPPVGEVKPAPEGCISMTFLAVPDEKRLEKNERGRVTSLITAEGKKLPVTERINLEIFDDVVATVDAVIHGADPSEVGHTPNDLAMGHVPGPAAWEYLKRYLLPADTVWAFGQEEVRGIFVAREGKLFCVVVCPIPTVSSAF
jgi:hypothetical protein